MSSGSGNCLSLLAWELTNTQCTCSLHVPYSELTCSRCMRQGRLWKLVQSGAASQGFARAAGSADPRSGLKCACCIPWLAAAIFGLLACNQRTTGRAQAGSTLCADKLGYQNDVFCICIVAGMLSPSSWSCTRSMGLVDMLWATPRSREV